MILKRREEQEITDRGGIEDLHYSAAACVSMGERKVLNVH